MSHNSLCPAVTLLSAYPPLLLSFLLYLLLLLLLQLLLRFFFVATAVASSFFLVLSFDSSIPRVHSRHLASASLSSLAHRGYTDTTVSVSCSVSRPIILLADPRSSHPILYSSNSILDYF